MDTIDEAKKHLRENWEKGTPCPCCGQFVKLYRRKLTSGMAVALIRLYRLTKLDHDEYVHITKLGHLNGGEFAQLVRWSLIQEMPNDNDVKRTSGNWRITRDGILFVKGELSVASHVYTYNGKTIKFSKTSTDIHEALGNKFNYKEIMGL